MKKRISIVNGEVWNQMYLRDFSKATNLTVVRDGEFFWLSKVTSLNPNGKNLIFLEKPAFLSNLNLDLVSAIILPPNMRELASTVPEHIGVALSESPKFAFYKIHLALYQDGYYDKTSGLKHSSVSQNAIINKGTYISEYGVEIGDGTVVENGVIIEKNVRIGKNCKIYSGAIIGTECTEVAQVDGKQIVVPHVGSVFIEDNVTIMAGVIIARGVFPHEKTVIKNEAILGPRVFVSHGVEIGEKTIVTAGTIISGNTKIGANCWIGPGSVISNRLRIGDRGRILIGSVVVRHVPEQSEVGGNFAMDSTLFMKHLAKIMLGG